MPRLQICSVNIEHVTLRTRDGEHIGLRCFHPLAGSVGRVLVIGPGAGVEQSFYDAFAAHCAGHGLEVITFDYRGVGRSGAGRQRDTPSTLRQWAIQDLDAVLVFARQHFPKRELIFLGHCISGEIAGIAPASAYINRIILVSSALSCWRLWPRRSQPKIWLMKLLAPVISAWYGYFPGARLGFLGDLPRGVVREFSDWCNLPNGLFDLFPDNNYRKLRIPLLAFSFSDDWFSPPRAVSALLDHFSAASCRWLHLQPVEVGLDRIGHDGFFSQNCQPLWTSTLQWIEQSELEKGYFF